MLEPMLEKLTALQLVPDPSFRDDLFYIGEMMVNLGQKGAK